MENIEMKYLAWDSGMLGVNCGLIDLTPAKRLSDNALLYSSVKELLYKNSHIEFVLIKLPETCENTVKMIMDLGGLLIDKEITLRYSGALKTGAELNNRDFRYEFRGKTEYEPFLHLAGEMKQSRFFRDYNISQERALYLWKTSIKNHCEGLADDLLVAYCGENPCGLIAVKIAGPDSIFLHIVGVLSEYQGKGIGREMLGRVIDKYAGRYNIYVETQSENDAARNIYQKTGFVYDNIKYILHYWRRQ